MKLIKSGVKENKDQKRVKFREEAAFDFSSVRPVKTKGIADQV